jgi:hypothetical protein
MKNPVQTVTDIKPYTQAFTLDTELGDIATTSQNKVDALQYGYYPKLKFEIGGINSKGLKNTETNVIRTQTTFLFKQDTVFRCNNSDYAFNLFEYSGKEISTQNYVGFSGTQRGTYIAKANTYYVLTIFLRTQATVTNIDTYASVMEAWTPFYLETKQQNTFKRFSPWGNAKHKIVSHKGNTSEQPENTIPAFEAAGTGGSWGIETDVQVTSDGYLVCIHDTTLDRTTNGTGNVIDHTLAQIRALHIKNHDDLQVPTIEEFLSVCKVYDCVPVLELKNMAGIQTAVSKLIQTLIEYGLETKSIITLQENCPYSQRHYLPLQHYEHKSYS